jgi:pantetheine-phosphate adenylyltransferase
MKTLGIYCGSFAPFHLGHLDIAAKAQKIFDKVLIVQATNVEKKNAKYKLPASLSKHGFYTLIIKADELLTDFINNLEDKKYELFGADYDSITIIRGLRNEKDFEYEENLCAAYRMLKPDVNIIHIFSDPKYNFVSSTLLRNYGHLDKFKHLLVK